jgi:hypothetical protein
MPHSPLYPDHLFPTYQMLLSRLPALPVVAVTADSFRKHILRLKPELKRLVPALAQADAEADFEAARDVTQHSGGSDHEAASSAPAQSPMRRSEPQSPMREDVLATDEGGGRGRGTDGAPAEDPGCGAVRGARCASAKKRKLARPEPAESSDEDEDLPLCFKLQGRAGAAHLSKKRSCDTPPSEPTSPPRDERQMRSSRAGGTSGEALEAVAHQCDQASPAGLRSESGRSAPASSPQSRVPDASTTAGTLAGRSSPAPPAAGSLCAKVSYAQKRWVVVALTEGARKDGSWAMTLRVKRKRGSRRERAMLLEREREGADLTTGGGRFARVPKQDARERRSP